MATNQVKHPAALEGPATRFGKVRGFFLDRKARNYFSVFAAVGTTFTAEEEARIAEMWNSRSQPTPDDVPLIERMERVVEHLKAA